MGNIATQCIVLKRARPNVDPTPIEAPVTEPPTQIILNNPIDISLYIMKVPKEEESIGLTIVLSDSISRLTNGDQTENGLQYLLEYLHKSLPLDNPLSGSATLLILREAPLSSRSFLAQVSNVLMLKSLSDKLQEIIELLQQSSLHDTVKSVDENCSQYECVDATVNEDDRGYGNDVTHSLKQPNDDELLDMPDINHTLSKSHNACVLIDCLATRPCGSNIDFLLDDDVIRFLIICCQLSKCDINGTWGHLIWSIVLRAILCFEKFALTRNCKNTICEYFEMHSLDIPFQHLETLSDSTEMITREIGMVSQWLLDNMYTRPGRPYTYLSIDRTNLNAVMSTSDASQYIKVSPIGLEVRSDSDSIESVRCTFEIMKGTFYYETQLVTSGIMQIGFATKNSRYMNHEGHGIGCDEFSMSYDGCRRIIWYNGYPFRERQLPKWKPGDILGCLVSVPGKFVVFSINGQNTKRLTNLFLKTNSGFFAGASFFYNQQCIFNFGREPFQFPPIGLQYSSFNDEGCLDSRNKIILPRTILLAQINQSYEQIDDPCGICFNVSAEVCLEPCNHKGFCKTCISRVHCCPLCRSAIRAIKSDPIYFPSFDGDSSNYQPPR